MKVICIENICTDGKPNPFLIKGKTYDLTIDDTVYIIDDEYFMDLFSYNHFFISLQEHRENKINQIYDKV